MIFFVLIVSLNATCTVEPTIKVHLLFDVFFCFVFVVVVLCPTQEYFTHIATSLNAGEGLQILAYAQHLWPLYCTWDLTFYVSFERQETDLQPL